MAAYDNLRAVIAANVYQNNNNEVTADMVKAAMNAMVASLGAEFQFGGMAEPGDNPGTPDYKVAYLASTPGTYSNFGGITLADGEVAILKWDGETWAKETTVIATQYALLRAAQIEYRGAYIMPNVVINNNGGVYTLDANTNYDLLIVRLPIDASRINLLNFASLTNVRIDFYSDDAPNGYVTANHISRVSDVTSGYSDIPPGAKMAAIRLRKSDFTDYQSLSFAFSISRDAVLEKIGLAPAIGANVPLKTGYYNSSTGE